MDKKPSARAFLLLVIAAVKSRDGEEKGLYYGFGFFINSISHFPLK